VRTDESKGGINIKKVIKKYFTYSYRMFFFILNDARDDAQNLKRHRYIHMCVYAYLLSLWSLLPKR